MHLSELHLAMYVILSQANGPSGSKAQETCDSLDLGVSDSQFRPDDKWEAITGASFHNTNIFSIHETVVGHWRNFSAVFIFLLGSMSYHTKLTKVKTLLFRFFSKHMFANMNLNMKDNI